MVFGIYEDFKAYKCSSVKNLPSELMLQHSSTYWYTNTYITHVSLPFSLL